VRLKCCGFIKKITCILKSRARYHVMFDSLREGFAFLEAVHDARGEVVDYQHLDANPSYERMFGHTRDMLLGKAVRETMPDAGADVLALLRSVAKSGVTSSVEVYVPATRCWVNVRAYVPGRNQLVAVVEDITDKKAAAGELADSEDRISILLDSSLSAILILSDNGLLFAPTSELQNCFV
jgi:PAS domain S-box-containing protein